MDANWPRWIFASCSYHFEQNVGGITMFTEGTHRDTELLPEFIEFRMDGPYFTQLNKNYWHCYFEINILLQATMLDTDFHAIHRLAGTVAAAFTEIQIFKYGEGLDDDDSLIACANLKQDVRKRERIQINHFGQVEPETKLIQATVEGHYEMHLDA